MSDNRASWTLLDEEVPGPVAETVLNFLLEHVVGQDDAIRSIADAIDMREASIRSGKRPIYSALLLGPSGVGKTYLVKILALCLLDSIEAFTRVDGQVVSERHGISKLIGSPPGYVAYGEPPILAQKNIDKWALKKAEKSQGVRSKFNEAVENKNSIEQSVFQLLVRKYLSDPAEISVQEGNNIDKIVKELVRVRQNLLNKIEALKHRTSELKIDDPLSILLFDEIERGDEAFHNLLFSILDEGEIQLSNGAITSFRNSIIIMTSNVGSEELAEVISLKKRIGIYQDEAKSPESKDSEIYRKSMGAARKAFSAPLLNRFDRISVFRPLPPDAIRKIFDLELKKFENEHLRPMFVSLEMDEAVKIYIVAEATDKPDQGARLLNRKIFKHLSRQIARLKNRKELQPGDIIHVVFGPDGKRIQFYKEGPRNLLGPARDPES